MLSSIRTKLAWPLLLTSFAVGGGGSWLTYHGFAGQLQEAMMLRAQLVSNAVTYAAESAEPEELIRIVNSLGGEQDVRFIAVVAGRPKRVIACTKNKWIGDFVGQLPEGLQRQVRDAIRLREQQEVWNRQTALFRFSKPLLIAREGLGPSLSSGSLVVHLDTHRIQRELWSAKWRLTGWVMAVAILTAASAYLVTHFLVLGPIRLLTQFIDRRASDHSDTGQLLGVTTNDEIGRVARAMNTMVETIVDREARTQTIVNTAADGIITVDDHGVIESFNPAAERIFGYAADQVIGENISVLMPQPDRTGHDRYLLRYLRAGQKRVVGRGREVIARRHDGSTFAMDLAISEVDLGGRRLFTGICRDISERKRMQEDLRHSERRLREIIDLVPHMIFARDRYGRLILANKAVADAYGTTPDKLVCTAHSDWHRDNDELQHMLGDDQQVLRTGQPKFIPEEPFTDAQRRQRVLQTIKIPHTLFGDDQPVVLGVATDITELKHVEKELLAYQHRLRAMTSKLAITEEHERRRIADELHDQIGQSLAAAKMKISTALITDPSQPLAQALAEAQSLIDQTIAATRSLTFELVSPVLNELGLQAALEALVEDFRDQHHLPCRLHCTGQVEPANDAVRLVLYKAVRELLFNVVKYARAQSAYLTLERDGDQVQIQVQDDGIGFEAPKTRFHLSPKGGFGLFNIGERLDYLGGSFHVQTQPGAGTCVTLRAPLDPIPPHPTRPTP